MGKNPTSEVGHYFRNNWWYWRPLWDYVATVGHELISDELYEGGGVNDGAGLDGDSSRKLGLMLIEKINQGHTHQHKLDYDKKIADLPRESCDLCDGTGIRADAVGIEHGMPTQKLDPAIAAIVGRTHGTCNKCSGEGTTESFLSWYHFDVENVRDFANFLLDCGGFEMW